MAVDFRVTEEDVRGALSWTLKAERVLSEHKRLGQFLTSFVFSRGHMTQLKFILAIENWLPVKSE